MNYFYYSLFILFCPLLSWAQPVIDVSIAPEIGNTWDVTYLESDAFNPGPAGANQNWDFSNLNVSNSLELTFETLAPEDVLGNENFPTADFVWYIPLFEIYEFYEVEEDSISLMGGVSISEGEIDFMTIYTDPEDAIQLPLNYGDSYDYYSYFEQYLFGSLLAGGNRVGGVTVDGYGTISTPMGTYSNVLRMKIEETSFGFTNTQYAWFDKDNFIPILVYETSEDPETPPSVYFSIPNVVNNATEVLVEKTVWNAYYNADAHTITAAFSTQMNVERAELVLTDIQGRTLQRLPQLDIAPGLQLDILVPAEVHHQVLFLSIYNGKKVSTKKVLISH